MGGASAALGIIKRVGLGKVRHLDTNYLWVQERAAKKEIEYGKVKGTENPGDLLTKGLSSEKIEHFIEMISIRTTSEKDAEALSTRKLNILGAESIDENVMDEVNNKYGIKGEMYAWTQRDLSSSTLKTSMKGGPKWNDVLYRITLDTETNQVMCVEDARALQREDQHRRIPGEPRDLKTILLYTDGENHKDMIDWNSTASLEMNQSPTT